MPLIVLRVFDLWSTYQWYDWFGRVIYLLWRVTSSRQCWIGSIQATDHSGFVWLVRRICGSGEFFWLVRRICCSFDLFLWVALNLLLSTLDTKPNSKRLITSWYSNVAYYWYYGVMIHNLNIQFSFFITFFEFYYYL